MARTIEPGASFGRTSKPRNLHRYPPLIHDSNRYKGNRRFQAEQYGKLPSNTYNALHFRSLARYITIKAYDQNTFLPTGRPAS
jgi:hypothetical protein